ncbi:MAG: NAD(+) synthase, partial [candidate division Zixibacteria bacterium]|nr:NAD(+) synthase [candidate division Zixibacteria bacterium]
MTVAEFSDVRRHGFVRVAVAVPRVRVAHPLENVQHHLKELEAIHRQGAYYALCPELGLSGYTCGDLFHSRSLLDASLEALAVLVETTAPWGMVVSTGLPFMVDHAVFNVAVTCAGGQILSAVPKTYLPQYREFYERRYFASASETRRQTVTLCGQTVPFGPDILIRTDDPRLTLYTTVCEDDWVPVPPSSRAALAGATVLANLSASNIVIGKAKYREDMILASSARNQAVHLYSAAGFGESTMDTVWDGHAFVAERGYLLARSERFRSDGTHIVVDADVESLTLERSRQGSFRQNAADYEEKWREVQSPVPTVFAGSDDTVFHTLRRTVSAHPFVPGNPAERDERCREVFMIQSSGLATKLMSLPPQMRKVVVAVSGGQDSTHALNVAVHTMDMLGLPRPDITALTMPGFGTTDRTYDNACALIRATGASFREIDIKPVVRQLFADIGHDERETTLVYENSQAWLRKIEEMATAAQIGGIVLGTGDLSELALGWCTMFGDHAAHYGVNAGIPKTLISYLIRWTAEVVFKDEEDVRV